MGMKTDNEAMVSDGKASKAGDGKAAKAANAARNKEALKGAGRLMRSCSGKLLGMLADSGYLFKAPAAKELKRRADKRAKSRAP